MRSTLLSTFVLGLLPSLAVAVIDEDAVNSLPIFSSLDGTLGLITQGNFNVDFTIQQDTESFVVPYITFAPIRLPEFRLTNGNLTTADRDRAAFYGPTTRIFPPPLIPLRFGTGFDRFAAAEFLAVTKTDSSGNDVLRLFALNGREYEHENLNSI